MPVCGLAVPAMQSIHVAAETASNELDHVPAPHLVGAAETAMQYEPAGHGTSVGLVEPAGQ